MHKINLFKEEIEMLQKMNKEMTENSTDKKLDNIKEFGMSSIADGNNKIQILPIIGQIEGHVTLPPETKATKYEHVIPNLILMENDPRVEGVLVVLNTVGGDVEAGLAIAEMIRSLSKPTVSLVIGEVTLLEFLLLLLLIILLYLPQLQ